MARPTRWCTGPGAGHCGAPAASDRLWRGGRSRRGSATKPHEGLRDALRSLVVRAVPQRQAPADDGLLSERARPRAGLRARGPDRESQIPARQAGARPRACSRSGSTPCFSTSATPMSATCPRPSRCSGRRPTIRGEPPKLSEVVGRLHHQPGGVSAAAGRLARLARRDRPLGLAQTDHRLAANRRVGAPRQDGARALAAVEPNEIEEVWHGLEPPYETLFAWLEGRASGRTPSTRRRFAPPCWPMRSRSATCERSTRPISRPNGSGTASASRRVAGPTAMAGGMRELYSRAGEDVSGAFPDLLESLLDRTFRRRRARRRILVVRDERVESFGTLQQRLNRKTCPRRAYGGLSGSSARL